MKYIITPAISLAIMLFAACSSSDKPLNNGGSGSEKLTVDVDSIAYIIGMNIGENINKMDSTQPTQKQQRYANTRSSSLPTS